VSSTVLECIKKKIKELLIEDLETPSEAICKALKETEEVGSSVS